MIDKFAEATGDHQWIHVDAERAKREMPGRQDDRPRLPDACRWCRDWPRRMLADAEAQPRHQLRLEQGALHHARSRPARASALRQRLVSVEEVAGNGVRVTLRDDRGDRRAESARLSSPRPSASGTPERARVREARLT